MSKLTPQQKKILCPTVELYMKDDRKRFSELREMGFVFAERKRCEIPEHRHDSKSYLRKLLAWPSNFDRINLTFRKLVFGDV